MTTAATHGQTGLLDAYRALPDHERHLLQLLALFYAPVSRTMLVHAMARAGVRFDGRPPTKAATIEPVVQRLKAAGLLAEVGERIRCESAIMEPVARATLTEGRFGDMAQAVRAQDPGFQYSGYRFYREPEEVLRDLRLALFAGNLQELQSVLHSGQALLGDLFRSGHPLRLLVERPFDAAWFDSLAESVREPLLAVLVMDTLHRLTPIGPLEQEAERFCIESPARCSTTLRAATVAIALLRGRWEQASAIAAGWEGGDDGLVKGWITTFGDAPADALEHFERFRSLASGKRRGKAPVPWDYEPVYFFALLRTGNGDAADAYRKQRCGKNGDPVACELLLHTSALAQATFTDEAALERMRSAPLMISGVYALLHYMVQYWAEPAKAKAVAADLEGERVRLERAGYAWLAAEVAELLARIDPQARAQREAAAAFRRGLGITWSAVDLVKRVEPWQRALNALSRLAGSPGEPANVGEERLIWLLAEFPDRWEVEAKVQKRTAKGTWTTGRSVSPRKLYLEGQTLPYVTGSDQRVINAIRRDTDPWGYGDAFELPPAQALPALAGHPLAFRADDRTRIEVVTANPELLVQRRDGQLSLRLEPDPAEWPEEVAIIPEGLHRLRVVVFEPRQRDIGAILDGDLTVPESAAEQVLASLGDIAGFVTVHSDIGAGGEVHETVAGDPTPVVQLLPFEGGVRASAMVRPFGERGPYYHPASGGRTVIAELGEKRVQADRDFAAEQGRADELDAACPLLAAVEQEDGIWYLPEPDQALELLEGLHGLGERVRIEWPEGERFRLRDTASARQLRVNVRSAREWFTVDGGVELADGRVLDMMRLLELVDQGPGRFLHLGEGEYLALTREFRRRLDDLRGVTERSGKRLKVPALAGLVLDDLAEEAGEFVGDKGWQGFRERFEAAQAQPEVPSTLQAELRDYQTEGYRWLARLAHWGVGACLADDMGLGKTVQALAMLLQRAPEGPALVVAPTSVAGNWRLEAARFAPTLNVIHYAAADRAQVLADPKPFDLVVCSYGLLQQDADPLAQVPWHTVILDEAQAIKNAATKRSKAAMALQGTFKVLTTGTPVENHLGELWNLFRFINPGLLGSLERFNRRFAAPIERDRDAAARATLRKLIQPFILRRTKSQVLDELPPRTEVLQQVELHPDERVFYEALRGRAIETLETMGGDDGGKGPGHLRILAEITRLRRACCNSRLVKGGPKLPSAKLEAFGEIVDELLENRHKALVFSQFVDHLALLREHLDRRGITYQYLDGGTPAGERDKRVKAFQGGEGDLFLISLKAGGVGLNLTAADYVIHMDPWWNPAVEDQAADRAHRMGQQRPVTVYRLVAKDTIEEKIVALHGQKRDLADSLLAEADVGGKVSAEELVRLLREA